MRFASSVLFLLTAASTALAADCFDNGNPGFTIDQFQRTAAQVCNQGPDAQIQWGDTGYPDYHNKVIQAHYDGTTKEHCWDAFNNIISQCVQGSGRNGGKWDYDYGNDKEHFYIQGIIA